MLTFNRAAQAMFGFSASEAIGRNVSILMDTEVRRSPHVRNSAGATRWPSRTSTCRPWSALSCASTSARRRSMPAAATPGAWASRYCAAYWTSELLTLARVKGALRPRLRSSREVRSGPLQLHGST
ncbi:hypothetical protein [Paracidovorax cattleyae]|uniref:hypothetical protein n=1 Tax=Paracidovorax cattleyae TaxID=80868 RepID=UPI00366ED777